MQASVYIYVITLLFLENGTAECLQTVTSLEKR